MTDFLFFENFPPTAPWGQPRIFKLVRRLYLGVFHAKFGGVWCIIVAAIGTRQRYIVFFSAVCNL